MKKSPFVVMGILVVLVVVLAGCANAVLFSGTSVNRMSVSKATSWTTTASYVDGNESRTVNMSADDLAALNVTSTNSSGTLSFTITQGDAKRTVDISGQFSGSIDTSGFTAGKVSMRLDYTSAKDTNISITW